MSERKADFYPSIVICMCIQYMYCICEYTVYICITIVHIISVCVRVACKHHLRYVPAYWQTKHTSGALCNTGGVSTVKPSNNSEAARCCCLQENCYELFMNCTYITATVFLHAFSTFLTAVQTCHHGRGQK